ASSSLMAALGRPFSLGMLYDCRQDSLIPGKALKSPNLIPQPNSEFEIVASESTEDKSSALNVQASLKASFLAGLVEVEGSAKYLNDCKISKNQARVTLKYKTTTKYQELSMRHLGRDNVKHPYVFDKGIATHVVKGILYGAQAFFVFDREVSEKEDHKDIEGSLKVMIQQIPGLVLQGQDSLQLTETDTANVQNFSCKFHGDFNLQRHPVSFQDAIEVYQSLPTLLGANGENAVPVKVWLMPLKILDSAAAQLVRQISIRLVMEVQSVLEVFSELEMRCNDAMKNSTTQQFPQIGKKLKAFGELCSEYKLEFQRTLAEKLPSIRGGKEEEAVLAEVLKMRHSSPFNNKNLSEWMSCKEREINIIEALTDMMKNTKIVTSRYALDKEILSAEHAVCFAFTSLEDDEPYLSDLSKYLKETPEIWNTMRQKSKLFNAFGEIDMDNNISFLIAGLANEKKKGASIHLYKEGSLFSESFEPPSKPEKPAVSDTTHNCVTVRISPPGLGTENITHYSVEYCVSGEDDWQQMTVLTYKIHHKEGFKIPYSFTIIHNEDFPHKFFSSEVFFFKRRVRQIISRLFMSDKLACEIDAVCLVIQASFPGPKLSYRYVFDSMLKLFDEDVAENIRIVVTSADDELPPVLEVIKSSKFPCPKTDSVYRSINM
uniref:Uncharacterized protein n=1 Tax=Myripristis murdjan TaxID=586833 RepID=A0A667ZSX9_9TELE